MEFLARANSNNVDFGIWHDGSGKVNYPRAGDLRHEHFAALHLFNTFDHKLNALLQREPETRHAFIRDGDRAALTLFKEQWNDRAAAPHDVSISDTGVTGRGASCVG